MFENTQQSKNGVKNKNLASVNMVSEGTEIIGKLITQSDIRIAGDVDGEAKVDGKVIVSSTGHVEGNLNATHADIAGKVDGEVHADSKLILRESAKVECDIFTQKLVVEEGASFNGACHMHDESEVKSKKSSSKKDSVHEDGEEKVNA